MKKYFTISQFFLAIFVVTFFTQSFSYAQPQPIPGSFEFDGHVRIYEVYLPQNFEPNMPLVISIHGRWEDIQWYKDYTEMHTVADTMGFVLVFPQGTADPGGTLFSWNIGLEGFGEFPKTDDVGFISTLIDTVKKRWDIDLSRVYCCGYSAGEAMTFRLAGELGDRIAAIAGVCGPFCGLADTWQFNKPMPLLHMFGTEDTFVPIDGQGDKRSAEETMNYWLNINGCTGPPDSVYLPDIVPEDNCTMLKISYTNCDSGSKCIFYKGLGMGHSWPGSKTTFINEGNKNLDINANVEILKFLRQFSNPLVNFIQKEETKLPSIFRLHQNYPNPFNPTTNIQFSIPKTEFVTLKIYNLLGQEVSILVSDIRQAGNYKVEWDASGFASGVYLYRLETDKGFFQTKKLILLK